MKTYRRTTPTRRSKSAVRAGFTLLELLIVLGIIVAIAAMVAPNLMGSRDEANINIARTQIKTIEDAFKRKNLKMNGYEDGSGSDKISALAEAWESADGRQQQPLLEEIPMDPWGNEFQYTFASGDMKPTIWSFGPDGQDNSGSGDDISNARQDKK